jgi:tetratricopeptide (TPR) repeat protein
MRSVFFKSKKYLVFVFFLLSSVISINGQQKENISKKEYENIIVKGFYKFQNNEKPEFLDSLLTIIKLNKFTIKEDSINSKILYLEGVNNLELKMFKKAEDLFIKSFELAKKTSDIFLIGSIYNARGIIFSLEHKNEVKAALYYKKAIANYSEVSNLLQLINTYYNLVINARLRGEWHESITYAKSFLKLILKDSKRTDGIGQIYYFIADSYFELSMSEKALINLENAEKFISADNSKFHSLINRAYAKYYESKGDYILAIQKYKEVNNDLEKKIISDNLMIKESFVYELELETELKNKQNFIINNQKTKQL